MRTAVSKLSPVVQRDGANKIYIHTAKQRSISKNLKKTLNITGEILPSHLSHTPSGSLIASHAFKQLHNKVPIRYKGTPHIHPQNSPSREVSGPHHISVHIICMRALLMTLW